MTQKRRTSRKTKVAPSRLIAVNQQVRRILLRRYRRPYDPRVDEWPNPTRYAYWCDCTTLTLTRYLKGRTERLDPDILDALAFLTGVCPTAGRKERKARIADADACARKAKVLAITTI